MFQLGAYSVFIVIGAVSLAAPADRVSLDQRDVPTEQCTTRASGHLSGPGNQKFSISQEGTRVTNAGPETGGLQVEFQACDPNFTGYPNSGEGPYVGHLYVPEANKCLQVPSYNPNATYQLLLEDCYYSHDSGQFAYSFLQKGSEYYWSGATMSDGSLIQGQDAGCADGLYGYQGVEGDTSITSGDLIVACASSPNVKAFNIQSS